MNIWHVEFRDDARAMAAMNGIGARLPNGARAFVSLSFGVVGGRSYVVVQSPEDIELEAVFEGFKPLGIMLVQTAPLPEPVVTEEGEDSGTDNL